MKHSYLIAGMMIISAIGIGLISQNQFTQVQAISGTPVLWLDATDSSTLLQDADCGIPLTSDGDFVRCWQDKSGNAQHVTTQAVSNPPAYRENQFNGLSVLEFAKGNAEYLQATSPNWQEDATIAIVFQATDPDNLSTNDAFFANNTSADDDSMQIDYDGTSQFRTKVDTATYSTNFATASSSLNLYTTTVSYDTINTTVTTYSDGQQAEQNIFSGDKGRHFRAYRINNNRAGGNHTDSKIAEVVVYDYVLTACELEELNFELGEKYGRDFSGISSNYGFSSPHNNDITGIGEITSNCGGSREYVSATSSILSVHSASSLDVDDYITFAHNNASVTQQATDVPDGIQSRLSRSWLFDKDNDAGTVTITFDVDALVIDTSDTDKLALLVSSDSNFASSTKHAASASINGSKISFTTIEINNGDYITLAIGSTEEEESDQSTRIGGSSSQQVVLYKESVRQKKQETKKKETEEKIKKIIEQKKQETEIDPKKHAKKIPLTDEGIPITKNDDWIKCVKNIHPQGRKICKRYGKGDNLWLYEEEQVVVRIQKQTKHYLSDMPSAETEIEDNFLYYWNDEDLFDILEKEQVVEEDLEPVQYGVLLPEFRPVHARTKAAELSFNLAEVFIPDYEEGEDISNETALAYYFGITTPEEHIEKLIIEDAIIRLNPQMTKTDRKSLAESLEENNEIEEFLEEHLSQDLKENVMHAIMKHALDKNQLLTLTTEKSIAQVINDDDIDVEILKQLVQKNSVNIEVTSQQLEEEIIVNPVEVFVQRKGHTKISLPSEYVKFQAGSVMLVVEPVSGFTPSEYTIEIVLTNPLTGKSETVTQVLQWGMLVLNTDADSYGVGGVANIDMTVLSNETVPICDAAVILVVTKPNEDQEKIIAHASGDCDSSVNNIQQSDYHAQYQFLQEGKYTLEMQATVDEVTRTESTVVLVQDNIPLRIYRKAATRIYSNDQVVMNINAEFTDLFFGTITETLPPYATVSEVSSNGVLQNNAITWDISAEPGEKKSFSYTYAVPDVSPQMYLFGPMYTDDYTESHVWHTMVDSPLAGCSDAATIAWSSDSIDLDWNNPANWHTGVAPTKDDVVCFYERINIDANISNSITVKGIELHAGYTGVLHINNDVEVTLGKEGLIVNGGVIKNAGKIIYSADTARLRCQDQVIGSIQLQGDVQLESDCIVHDLMQNSGNLYMTDAVKTFIVTGNVTQGDTVYFGAKNAVLVFNGETHQTINQGNNSYIHSPIIIDKTAGTVFVNTNFVAGESIEVVNGTIEHTGELLVLRNLRIANDGIFKKNTPGSVITMDNIQNNGVVDIQLLEECASDIQLHIRSGSPGTIHTWSGKGNHILKNLYIKDQIGLPFIKDICTHTTATEESDSVDEPVVVVLTAATPEQDDLETEEDVIVKIVEDPSATLQPSSSGLRSASRTGSEEVSIIDQIDRKSDSINQNDEESDNIDEPVHNVADSYIGSIDELFTENTSLVRAIPQELADQLADITISPSVERIENLSNSIKKGILEEKEVFVALTNEVFTDPAVQKLVRTMSNGDAILSAMYIGNLTAVHELLLKNYVKRKTREQVQEELNALDDAQEYLCIDRPTLSYGAGFALIHMVHAADVLPALDAKEQLTIANNLLKKMRTTSASTTKVSSLEERLEYLNKRSHIVSDIIGVKEADIHSQIDAIQNDIESPSSHAYLNLAGIARNLRATDNFEKLEDTLDNANNALSRSVHDTFTGIFNNKEDNVVFAKQVLENVDVDTLEQGADIEDVLLILHEIVVLQDNHIENLLNTLPVDIREEHEKALYAWNEDLLNTKSISDIIGKLSARGEILLSIESDARNNRSLYAKFIFFLQDSLGMSG